MSSSRQTICKRRATALHRVAVLLVLLFALSPALGLAQIIADETPTPRTGFSVRKEDGAITEALAEFERYCGKGAWEKAFGSLTKVMEAQPKGLTPGKDAGMYLPTRVRLRQLLTNLPPEGKEAYRLFNDAKAKQAFAQLEDAEKKPAKRDGDAPKPGAPAMQLEDLFDLYFVTSVGDQIADRLGDALFERGDFNGAGMCWQSILTDYPDTTLSPLRVRTKLAIALSRAGRMDEFASARNEIRQRFGDQTLQIGGRSVSAAGFLDELAKSSSASAANSSTATTKVEDAPIALPASDDPLWQCTFADERYLKQIVNLANNGWWNSLSLRESVPCAAADAHRVYLNWYGVTFALDAETGKLIWRSDPFNDIATKLQQLAQSGNSTDMHGIAIAPGGQRVIFVRRSPAMLMQPQSRCDLTCVSADTGKRIWGSESGGLSSWSFAGRPLVRGETVFSIAHPVSSTELTLLAISLADGSVQWKVALGSAQAGMNYRGMPLTPVPTLEEHGGNLYVLAGQGALFAVNGATKRIAWAFTFGTPAPPNQERFYYGQPAREPPVFPSSMRISGSTLYLKDKSDARLYALDLAGPSLKWRRPVESEAMLLGADAANAALYMAGEALDCIDLATRDLRWSTKTSVDTSAAVPIVAGTHLYQFGSRGVYDVDMHDGSRKIFRGYDREGMGGVILRAGDRLITVSDRSVTAYPLNPSEDHK